MSDLFEVLLTTEATGQQWNVCAWNPTTGAALTTFKGSSSAPRSLCVVRDDYVISADLAKPLINVWAINRRDHSHTRIVCPGRVGALAVCSSGVYCVAGVGEKLYVWQISDGKLMAVLSGHYLKVTCVRFTDCGNYFVSGAEDGSAFVWSMNQVLSGGTHVTLGSAGVEPLHKWSRHHSAVTDIHVGYGRAGAWVATASLDKTVLIWVLSSGELLGTHMFECSISSVVMDDWVTSLYAGATNGNIYVVDLDTPTETGSDRCVLRGHGTVVTCLSINGSGTLLASGSKDGSVILWDTHSRENIEIIKHKGPVTNCALVRSPVNLLEPDPERHTLPFPKFNQTMLSRGAAEEGSEERRGETVSVILTTTAQSADDRLFGKASSIPEEAESAVESMSRKEERSTKRARKDEEEEVDLEAELARLKSINHKLYHEAVKSII